MIIYLRQEAGQAEPRVIAKSADFTAMRWRKMPTASAEIRMMMIYAAFDMRQSKRRPPLCLMARCLS